MTNEPVTVFDAATAAQAVGVSVSGLRRLAPIYEEVYGELPRGGRGSGDSPRLWPQDAAARLFTARTMVAAGQYRSVRDALLAMERGSAPSADAVAALGSEGNVAEALGLVLAEMQESRALNSALRVELAELRGQLAELRTQRQPAALPSAEPSVKVDVDGTTVTPNRSPGPFVRAAEWLERLLRGGRG